MELSPILVGLIGFAVLFIIMAWGMPIGVAMGLVGFVGIWYLISSDAALVKMSVIPFATIGTSYELFVLVLFVFMANVVHESGLVRDMFNLAGKWLGHQPGGIAMSTVAACTGFAAVSASSVATAATIGLVSLPEMKRFNYDPMLSTGVIAAGGTIGILIPPSGMLIIYGILTETSIGQLFVGGLIPGILEAVFYIALIYGMCIWKPSLGPRGPKSTFREKITAFGSCGEILALIALVLVGLIIGWFTPTEAGGVGAFGAIVFSMFRRRLNWEKFKRAVIGTLKTAGMLYGVLIGAYIFKFFLAITNIPFTLADMISELTFPPMMIMLCIMLIFLVLGCVMDTAAMTVLLIPIFFPIADALGFHPVWFGILLCRAMEMGMISPPIGMNVFVISGIAPDIPIQKIFKGIIPFLIADILHVALLMAVPTLVLFLPKLLY